MIRALDLVADGAPLLLLHGDPGTGKTATAHSLAGVIATDLAKPVVLIILNERIRGNGIQGRAGSDVVSILDTIGNFASKSDVLTLVLLDEAESIVGARAAHDVDSGEKENTAVVDGLIKGLDSMNILSRNRVLFLMCTNLVARVDPAVLRRARLFNFERPTEEVVYALIDRAFGDVFNRPEIGAIAVQATRSKLPLTPADIVGQIVLPAINTAAMSGLPLQANNVAELARAATPTSNMGRAPGALSTWSPTSPRIRPRRLRSPGSMPVRIAGR
ncbi:AAA family ATPase [Gordonia rhizosphera]|uniref:Putative ATPase n=1 Tax=Gordonia rhizosphera NBRC 16068 TaxID=1108045 RepID=K6WK94_9ACTN|nr:AAA family ATPase [Gordonia rhizosphera]GAB92582.1 putative ATPase [Gordonia rhizosphera NBRC 16068]